MRLDLDPGLIDQARQYASSIAHRVCEQAKQVTTSSIERTVVRLFGIDGVTNDDIPLPNAVVDRVLDTVGLEGGVARILGSVMRTLGLTPQQAAQAIVSGSIDPAQHNSPESEEALAAAQDAARRSCNLIKDNAQKRETMLATYNRHSEPLLYVIVATGNIYEDVIQAQAAARAGADIIAVIRSTAQSLLDYVPYGATTEGYGGTYATQENFRIMRKALDEASQDTGRYIRLVNYCSGLCMPEIAAMGAVERVDMMLNDAMYGVLFRDINMRRTFADQHFSRMINAYAGVIINTGEDNYLTTSDAVDKAHTVLASQFINEALAIRAGLRDTQIGLGHAFEIDTDLEDGFLLEIAHAQLSRDIFTHSPLKYMPPTKHMTGDVFRGYLMNGLFNLVGIMTGQSIQLLGMMTEAIHTPFVQDRYLAIKNAKYVFNTARHIGEDISFKAGGIIQTRASGVLKEAVGLLREVESIGLDRAIAMGMFADISREIDSGRGADGVFSRSSSYWNPFEDIMSSELGVLNGGGALEG